MKAGWIPPRSPFGLIQEDLVPNEWWVLVVAIMLNQTSRKQVEGAWPTFVSRWPTAQAFLKADHTEVRNVIKCLGFANRRTDYLLKMTRQYVAGDWSHASELHGIGEYGARSWEIFCRGIIGSEPPKDHALLTYWTWLKQRQPING